MVNLIIGIIVGIIIAELGGVPVIQEYITELFNAYNQIKED